MKDKTIEKSIIDITKRIKRIENKNILDVNILDFSSLEFVELIVEIEEEFGIQFCEDDLLLDKYERIGDIAKKVETYL